MLLRELKAAKSEHERIELLKEARAAVLQAPVVNMDETGWQQEQQRACLWTVVTDTLTVFRIDRQTD